jgi:hypothetical protein
MTTIAEFNPRWRRWAIAAAVLWFLTCLLWTAPASLFALIAQRAAPLQLDAVAGSFWRGRAGQAYVLLPNGRVALGSVTWRLKPWSLLWLHPSVHITADYGVQIVDTQLTVAPTGKLRLREMRGAVPLTALNHWLPLPANGLLVFNLPDAELDADGLRSLRGDVQWQQANWQWGSRWLALGDYSVQLQMQNAIVQGGVDGKGALAVKGKVDIDPRQKHYSVQAQLHADASLPQEFRDGLQLMLAAQPDAQGQLQVRREGKW